MIPRRDESGLFTAWVALLCAAALAVVTLIPFALALANPIYLAGALLLDAAFIACAVAFVRDRSQPTARRLFFASIIYLPVLLGLMVVTRS